MASLPHPLDQFSQALHSGEVTYLRHCLDDLAPQDLTEAIHLLVHAEQTELLIRAMKRLEASPDPLVEAFRQVWDGHLPDPLPRPGVVAHLLSVGAHRGYAHLMAPLAAAVPDALQRARALVEAAYQANWNQDVPTAQALAALIAPDAAQVSHVLVERMKESLRLQNDALAETWWSALAPVYATLGDRDQIQLSAAASSMERTAFYDRLMTDTGLAHLARQADKVGDLLATFLPHLAPARQAQVRTWITDAGLDPDAVLAERV